jgi:hypothetical protein
MMKPTITAGDDILHYCNICLAYLNEQYYSREHDDSHLKPGKYAKCEHGSTRLTCRRCNPNFCEVCGRIVGSDYYMTVRAHEDSRGHKDNLARLERRRANQQ